MKFWQKIYLFALLLVIFAIGLTGVILIQNLHNKLMEKEIEKSIAEEKLLSREIQIENLYFQNYIYSSNPTTRRSLESIAKDYMTTNSDEIKIQILDIYNNILFTVANFPTANYESIFDNLSSSTSNFIIKKVNDKIYIYICGISEFENAPIKVLYAKDITSIYTQRQDYYVFFIKLALWICFIFSIFMFFISRLLTHPIEKFIVTAQKISSGNYSERVQLHSKDEFRLLAIQFNIMAQTIETKITELEHSNKEKETFIDNFTHELKTPLTSIIGYADLMRTSKYDEKLFIECTDYICQQGKHLEQMAFKMMDLIYAKSVQLSLEPIKISELIHSIQMTFKNKLENKQVHIKTEIEVPIIIADPILIKMLLSNLIDNAIKASYKKNSIDISTTEHNHQVILSVQDYGTGISQEHLDKICQPFYIVDPARTSENNGAGIGLAICKKIAVVHQGILEIKSELGYGTKVSIILKH